MFVHGIFGDTRGTWTRENGSSFFDFVHNLPDLGSKLDIYAFGFSSHMLADGSLKIGEAAKKLDDFLEVDGVTKYDVVVFVAHSMGGLITMRELITNDKLRAKVPLLVFYATPHEGSQITTIGEHLLNNPALQQMLPVDANDYLQQINDDWKKVADATPHPAVICAYEKKPVHGILVVPWSSSTRNCTESASAIEDSDHLSIVKPDNARHPSVIVLTKALNRYVAPALDTASVDTPKFQKNGDPWVFLIENAGNRNAAVFESRASVPLSYTLESVDSRQLVVYPRECHGRWAQGAGYRRPAADEPAAPGIQAEAAHRRDTGAHRGCAYPRHDRRPRPAQQPGIGHGRERERLPRRQHQQGAVPAAAAGTAAAEAVGAG